MPLLSHHGSRLNARHGTALLLLLLFWRKVLCSPGLVWFGLVIVSHSLVLGRVGLKRPNDQARHKVILYYFVTAMCTRFWGCRYASADGRKEMRRLWVRTGTVATVAVAVGSGKFIDLANSTF
jgi:hypothetical protein